MAQSTQELTLSPRESGMDIVGEIQWGAHFSLFYDTDQDLLDVLVPFLEAGIVADELCIWMPSNPEVEAQVAKALRQRVADFDDRVARGQIEFNSGEDWYRHSGRFNVDDVMRRWDDVYRNRVASGTWIGLRATGDLGWVEQKDHEREVEYEGRLHEFMHNKRMVVLCSCPLRRAAAVNILDSARVHDFVLARRGGNWDSVEAPQHQRAVQEIERLNLELEQRVEQRTEELFAERKRSRARLVKAKRRARERALEARFAAILEERTRLAREIHDSLLQGVTGIALQLHAALPHLKSPAPETLNAIRRIAELADATVRDARQTVWEMRPLAIATADVPTALRDATRRVAAGHEVRVIVEGEPRALPAVVAETILRIAQESTMNAVKHSGTARVLITLSYRAEGVSLTVVDEGRGFDVETADRTYGGRWGILGMRERAHRIGGALSVRSQPGKGTTVRLEVALPDAAIVSASA
jgi:signal transduction histidine kinase